MAETGSNVGDRTLSTALAESLPDSPISVIRLLEGLCERWPVERIIVFGSRAVGDHDARSDFDLAISASRLSRREWIFLQDYVSQGDTLFKVAVTLLNDMPGALRNQVLSQGEVIYDFA